MIRLENVDFHYPDGTLALEGIDLEIRAGEFLVIAGANGSGKSTLLRLLNGLLVPEQGEVTVGGRSTQGSPVEIRTIVGFVFQDPDSQIIGETVAEDVAFGPENLGLNQEAVAARVRESLESLQLVPLAEKPCHLLSAGEKKRLALAGVMAMRPEVLVLDEPLANLDHPGVLDVLGHLARLHREGRTIILATHDVEKVVTLADRLAILKRGRLVRQGVPEELLADLESFDVRPPCATYLGHPPLPWLRD